MATQFSRKKADTSSRFWSKVNFDGPNGCWLWTASLSRGYGAFRIGPRKFLAHRIAYQELIAPIPDELTIDHLCLVRNCVNPFHMECVTSAENTKRRIPANSKKENCPKCGQPYDKIRSCGRRRCSPCNNAATLARYHVNRKAQNVEA